MSWRVESRSPGTSLETAGTPQALDARVTCNGRTIVITRHNEPVAQLGPARTEHVHQGARVGLGRIHPALKRGTKGRYLAVLLEDRGAR